MSLKKLLESFGDYENVPIPAYFVRDWLIENGHQDEINFFLDPSMNANVLRGQIAQWHYRSGPYGENKYVSDISISTNQSFCWQRFTAVKEMIHILDDKSLDTNDLEKIDRLTFDLVSPLARTAGNNPPVVAEDMAEVKALCVLCPLHIVDYFRERYAAGQLSNLDVATIFRIPEVMAAAIFTPTFAMVYRMFAVGKI